MEFFYGLHGLVVFLALVSPRFSSASFSVNCIPYVEHTVGVAGHEQILLPYLHYPISTLAAVKQLYVQIHDARQRDPVGCSRLCSTVTIKPFKGVQPSEIHGALLGCNILRHLYASSQSNIKSRG